MIVYIWAVMLFVITALYLCVCVDENRGGLLSKIKIALYKVAPNKIKGCIRQVLGEWAVTKVE